MASPIRELYEEIDSGIMELKVKLNGMRLSWDTVELKGQGLHSSNCLS